ncbi:MAG: hypothetical protein ACE5F6_03510 [Anaerolineae bacterium]
MAVAGWYLLAVYADDPATTALDEGAVAGDPIAFTINGHQAVPVGPDAALWSGAVDRLHVELRACTLAGDCDCDCRATVADLMRQARSFGMSRGQAGFYPPYDRDGDGEIGSGDLQAAGGWRASCQER